VACAKARVPAINDNPLAKSKSRLLIPADMRSPVLKNQRC
jgi:hypothetical protein